MIRSNHPNEIWEVDLIGRLPGSEGGNKYIFVGVDHYTKFIEAAVVAKKDCKTVANLIERLILKKHGIPKVIYSDNGSEFVNKEINNLKEKYSFSWKLSAPNYHKSTGAIERVNQTFLGKLKKLNNYNVENWEQIVGEAAHAVNISFNRAIGTSPYLLKYGRHPYPKIDEELKLKELSRSKHELMENRDRLFEAYADKNIVKGKRRVTTEYKLGDKVLVYRKALGNKLGCDWEKGFEIFDVISEDQYIVSNGRQKLKVHKTHLKKSFIQEKGMSL